MINDCFLTKISNVLVIGSGGSGLRSAIEASLSGLSVKVIGKRSKSDVHSVLAAGGINAAFGNVDKQDSWQQHFVDTYKEGYFLGDPESIEILVKESQELVSEIDKWGANLQKLSDRNFDQRFFGAHTYRRTCYSGDFTGRSIIRALLNKAEKLNIPIDDKQYVIHLLVSENQVYGAVSINMETGKINVNYADSVILATGGHTRIWSRSSSRQRENNGDGLSLALASGCSLIDMEMVQFHPTGMVKPEEISGTLVTEAVRGEGGKLFNSNGERFMQKYDLERMELSTRDRVAIANYTEIIEGRATPNGGVYLDISHKDKDFIISKLPRIYRQFIESQMLDISNEAMEVAPTAHYSMGGIYVRPSDHSTEVKGLFACGEVAGGVHGANRLGGNSLAEILVFGRRAGRAAVEFSRKLKNHSRNPEALNQAFLKVENFVKNGTEIGKKLEHEVHQIMWKYCGVVRCEEDLSRGLIKLNSIQNKIKDLDVRVNAESCDDLIQAFELEATLLSAHSTILSALKRKESRGAHQRKDFQKTLDNYKCNFQIKLKNGEIEIYQIPTKVPNSELNSLININSSKEINDFKGKLLE